MQPVIVPPQSDAPLDPSPVVGKQQLAASDLPQLRFKPDWYLCFQAIKDAVSGANGIVQFGPSTNRKGLETQGLVDGTLWLETDTGLVYRWNGATLQWFWVLGTMRATYKLTGSLTVNQPSQTASAAPGVKLVVALMQDATGGRALTWGAGFAFTSTGLGQALPSSASVFEFTLFSSADLAGLGITSTAPLWVMTSELTDMTQ